MPNPTNDDLEIQVDTNCVPDAGEVAFSPDGRWLALVRRDGRTELRNVTNHWTIERTMELGGWSLAFTPDSKILGMVSANYLRFFRVSDARLVAAYDAEPGGVTALAFSPDGRFFAYGRGDGAVVLARMPVVITNVVRTNAQTALEWQGGSGPYQVQQTSNVATGLWEQVGGPTTNTNATVPTTNPTAFFRIRSLTNAP
jgi:hypothetical protein